MREYDRTEKRKGQRLRERHRALEHHRRGGVKGMAYRSMTDGIVHLLRREAMSKGVHITQHDDHEISIELHIVVEHGVNISAVCQAIIGQVRYLVTENTGAVVRGVNVCVDSMTM